MSIQTRVQELFDKFNVNLTVTDNESVRIDLAEATLDNGTVVYTDDAEFNEGSEVYIINDEGERIAMPEGEYGLQDGGKMSIGAGGKVASVNKGGDSKAPNQPAKSPKDNKPQPKGKPASDGGDSSSGGKGGDDSGGKKVKKESEIEDDMNYVSKDEVEEMIASAIQAMKEELEHTPDHKKEEEDMTEMSVNPEAKANEAEAEVEIEVEVEMEEEAKEESKEEEAVELSAIQKELDETKAELVELQKQAASDGLKRATPQPKAQEPLNLANMTTEERIKALSNHYTA